jgi:hypothetical protein
MSARHATIPVRIRTDRWVMPFVRFARRAHLPFGIAGPIILFGLHAEVVR